MNSFDQKLPKTTTYWKENEYFFIKTTNFFIKSDEGEALAELLIYAMKDRETEYIVFDNREASGVWPQNISSIWETDERYLDLLGSKKMATLVDSVLKKMQTNRLSNEYGMGNVSRAFHSDFNDEVKSFLGSKN